MTAIMDRDVRPGALAQAPAGPPAPVVYIVDDDPELCESVSWLLESIGLASIIMNGADEFLAAYDGGHPACLVLDVRMPRTSGMQLQEELAAVMPHVAIIFVSAHGTIPMSVQTMRLGAVDFLEKPYEPQRLLDVVQEGMVKAAAAFREHRSQAEVQEKVDGLTPREREILRLVVEGLPSQNIARRLGMSVKTVDVHRARIKAKTAAESISTLVRDVLRFGATIRA